MRAKRQVGYTLVEMVTTLIIVLILSVAVYPRFFATLTYQQQVYYNEVLHSLRYARKLAIASGTHIQCSPSTNSLTLQRRLEGNTCNVGMTLQTIIDPTLRTDGYVKRAPGNLTLNFSSGWPIYFDGLGRAMHANTCTLVNTETITVVGGKSIKVSGETGFVE